MLKLIGFILVLAIGFGAGWVGRSYRATDACRDAGGVYDTNRAVCTGVGAPISAVPPPLT